MFIIRYNLYHLYNYLRLFSVFLNFYLDFIYKTHKSLVILRMYHSKAAKILRIILEQ